MDDYKEDEILLLQLKKNPNDFYLKVGSFARFFWIDIPLFRYNW